MTLYLDEVLYFLGFALVVIYHVRREPRLVVARRFQLLGFIVILCAAVAEALTEPATTSQLAALFASVVIASILIGWLAPLAAIRCLIGRHGPGVINTIRVLHGDDVVDLQIAWDPVAVEDREVFLRELLDHGTVVGTECSSCGIAIARHSGGTTS